MFVQRFFFTFLHIKAIFLWSTVVLICFLLLWNSRNKHYYSKQLREEGVYFILHFSISQQRKHGQDLKTRTRTETTKSAAYGLALYGLLSLLSYTTKDHLPGVTSSTVSWTIIHQSLIKKILPQTFVQNKWGSLLPGDPSFSRWQQIKPTRTIVLLPRIMCGT